MGWIADVITQCPGCGLIHEVEIRANRYRWPAAWECVQDDESRTGCGARWVVAWKWDRDGLRLSKDSSLAAFRNPGSGPANPEGVATTLKPATLGDQQGFGEWAEIIAREAATRRAVGDA